MVQQMAKQLDSAVTMQLKIWQLVAVILTVIISAITVSISYSHNKDVLDALVIKVNDHSKEIVELNEALIKDEQVRAEAINSLKNENEIIITYLSMLLSKSGYSDNRLNSIRSYVEGTHGSK
jgi:hypothetical protein